MIRPKYPPQTATVEDLIPRAVVHSDLAPSGDHIEILFPRHKDPLLLRFFAPYMSRSRRYERYPLDFRGSRIWCLLDGRRTVADVIDAYSDKYPGDAYQVPQRVWNYLQNLQQHGFIDMVGETSGDIAP